MVALEVSNTFNLQFGVNLEVKRGDGESNPGVEKLSNTFKLQFESNWSLNVEWLPGTLPGSGV